MVSWRVPAPASPVSAPGTLSLFPRALPPVFPGQSRVYAGVVPCVMADSRSGVQGSLLQLQESLSAADRCSAAMANYRLIRDVGQECVLNTDPAVLGGYRAGPRRGGSGGVWGSGRAKECPEACARFGVSEFAGA